MRHGQNHIGAAHRAKELLVAHRPAIDKKELMAGGAAVERRQTDIAGEGDILALGTTRKALAAKSRPAVGSAGPSARINRRCARRTATRWPSDVKKRLDGPSPRWMTSTRPGLRAALEFEPCRGREKRVSTSIVVPGSAAGAAHAPPATAKHQAIGSPSGWSGSGG